MILASGSMWKDEIMTDDGERILGGLVVLCVIMPFLTWTMFTLFSWNMGWQESKKTLYLVRVLYNRY